MAPYHPTLATCRVAPRPVNRDAPHQWQPSLSSSTTRKEWVMDRLATMRRFESTTYKTKDYMRHYSSCVVSRCLTVEYLYQVVDYGGFQRDVVSYAMCHLLDRYLSANSPDRARRVLSVKNRYQLVALTCLYMAVKLLEPNNIGVESLVPLTNHAYTVEDFKAMESNILKVLQWRVAHGPTSLAFVQHLLHLLPNPKLAAALYPHIQYQLELAVSDHALCQNDSSTVAIAAIWNALEAIDVSVFSKTEKARYKQIIQKGLGTWDEPRIIQIQATLRQLMLAAYAWSTTASSSSSSSSSSQKDTTISSTQNCPTDKKDTSVSGGQSSQGASPVSTVEGPKCEPTTTTPTTTTKSTGDARTTAIQKREQKQHPKQSQEDKVKTRDSSPSRESITDVSEVEWFLFAS